MDSLGPIQGVLYKHGASHSHSHFRVVLLVRTRKPNLSMPPSRAPHSSGKHWLDCSVSQDTRLRSPATLHTIGTPARVRASVTVQRSRLRVWLPPTNTASGGRLSTFVDGWNGIRNLHPKHHQSGVYISFTTSLLLHMTSWETGLGSNSTHARAGNLDASKECTSF